MKCPICKNTIDNPNWKLCHRKKCADIFYRKKEKTGNKNIKKLRIIKCRECGKEEELFCGWSRRLCNNCIEKRH